MYSAALDGSQLALQVNLKLHASSNRAQSAKCWQRRDLRRLPSSHYRRNKVPHSGTTSRRLRLRWTNSCSRTPNSMSERDFMRVRWDPNRCLQSSRRSGAWIAKSSAQQSHRTYMVSRHVPVAVLGGTEKNPTSDTHTALAAGATDKFCCLRSLVAIEDTPL